MKGSSLEFCPVPEEQQPLNEYEQLKDSGLFRWATLSGIAYGRKLAMVWLLGWILTGPIAAASFLPQKHPILFFLAGTWGTSLLLALVLLRIYLGWFYISDRLKSETVIYEESGWYDGQIWQKTPEVIMRDHLILNYQVEPILKRLRRTALLLGILIAVVSVSWLCISI